MGTVAPSPPSTLLPAPTIDATPVAVEVLPADELATFLPEWDACASAGVGNPFTQTPWFATAVWTEAARRGDLCLVAARDAAGTVQALTPLLLCRTRVPLLGLRVLRPLALHNQETSAVVVGAADRATASARIVDHLLAEPSPGWDVLHFPSIDPGSALCATLLDAASRHGLPVLMSAPMQAPVLEAAGDGSWGPSGPSSRFRRNIRRAWRVARTSGRRVVCREISWDWKRYGEAIGAVYRARWGEGVAGETYALDDPRCRAVLELLLGRLDRFFRAHAFAAFVDDDLAAYLVCFRAGADVFFWSTALAPRYRPLSAGILLWDHCLHELASWPGVERMHFGKGADRYKLAWTTTSSSVCELAVVRASGLRRRRALARFSALARADRV